MPARWRVGVNQIVFLVFKYIWVDLDLSVKITHPWESRQTYLGDVIVSHFWLILGHTSDTLRGASLPHCPSPSQLHSWRLGQDNIKDIRHHSSPLNILIQIPANWPLGCIHYFHSNTLAVSDSLSIKVRQHPQDPTDCWFCWKIKYKNE